MSIDSSELWFVCEGHAAARTVRLSPGWEQPLGRRAEQQLEQATLELIHPDDARGWLELYRSWFLGHFASGNHAAAPVLGKSAWRTAAGVRWPWRSTSQAWL